MVAGGVLEVGDVGGLEHGRVLRSIAGAAPGCKQGGVAWVRREGDTGAMVERTTQRVLVYRLGSLGDMLIALPALHLVARAFPRAERRLLTNAPVHAKAPAAAAVLDGTGLVHGYLRYTAGTRGIAELLGLWWQIVRFRPEVVVYMAASRGVAAAARDARFFRLCGVRRTIGVPLTGAMQGNFFGAEPGSAEARAMLSEARLEPEAARLARNLRELGDAGLEEVGSWSLQLSEREQKRAVEAIGPTVLQARCVAVSVGTKVQAKDWGVANWRALLGEVARTWPGLGLLLLGAAEEGEMSEVAAARWAEQGGGPVVNLCGRLTPRESAAAIARAKVFLGHDSGPMHLAAAVGTPLVAIFAARNIPRQWFPFGLRQEVVYHRVECWGCGLETCLEQRKKCIVSITVNEVLERVRRLLPPDTGQGENRASEGGEDTCAKPASL